MSGNVIIKRGAVYSYGFVIKHPTPTPFFLAFVFAREIENGSRKLEGEIEERGK